MASGGTGHHLDQELVRMLRRTTAQFPNHGLDGRVGTPVAVGSMVVGTGASNSDAGLPRPNLLRR